MADLFERRKSSRWVDAQKPSYGDDWGVEYNEDSDIEVYPLPPIVEQTPVPIGSHESHVSPADEGKKLPQSQSNEHAPDLDGDVSVHPVDVPLPVDTKNTSALEELPDHHNSDKNDDLSVYVQKAPVETFESVETPKSPVSFESTESFKNGETSKLAESSKFVESIESSKLANTTHIQDNDVSYADAYSPDQSDYSDTDSIQQEPTELHLAGSRHLDSVPTVTEAMKIVPEPLVLSIDKMNLRSLDDSSSDEEPSPSSRFPVYSGDNDSYGKTHGTDFVSKHDSTSSKSQEIEGLNMPEPRNEESPLPVRHRIQTEALDSLIDDLLKLEKLSLASLDLSNDERVTLGSTERHKAEEQDQHSYLEKESSYSFALESPSTLLEKHNSFISDKRARRASIRKAPPLVESHSDVTTKATLLLSSNSTNEEQDDIVATNDTSLAPIDSGGSISTGSPSFDADISSHFTAHNSSVDKKDSRVTSMAFTMGSWKPNTNVYRDRFVNSNDNESHMNVSMFPEGESGYSKFTEGTRPASGYAESFANSSCISIPDTIEANLQSIDEIHSDGDDPSLDVVSLGTAREAASVQGASKVSHPNATSLSLLRDSPYENGKFLERISSGNISGKGHSELETSVTTSVGGAYPVFNWKKIMATSQAIDRINLLKKAREDEEAYDTGLLAWLNAALHSTNESNSNIQIGSLATQAYKNAPHNDIRRHISLRSKVSMVRDKMDLGANFGRRFLSKGKKLMKSGSD